MWRDPRMDNSFLGLYRFKTEPLSRTRIASPRTVAPLHRCTVASVAEPRVGIIAVEDRDGCAERGGARNKGKHRVNKYGVCRYRVDVIAETTGLLTRTGWSLIARSNWPARRAAYTPTRRGIFLFRWWIKDENIYSTVLVHACNETNMSFLELIFPRDSDALCIGFATNTPFAVETVLR